MKKLFTLAALALCALTLHAQSTISFSEEKDAGSLDGQTITSTLDGFSLTVTDTKGKVAVDGSNARFGTAESNTSYSYRLKTGGKSSDANNMSITIPTSGTLQICVRTGSNSATNRNLVLTQDGKELYNKVVQESDATQITLDDGKTSKVYPVISVAVGKGTVDITYPTGSLNFYAFTFSTTTGISNVQQARPASDNAVYNLAGQRVSKDYKGVIICDGKKTVQK